MDGHGDERRVCGLGRGIEGERCRGSADVPIAEDGFLDAGPRIGVCRANKVRVGREETEHSEVSQDDLAHQLLLRLTVTGPLAGNWEIIPFRGVVRSDKSGAIVTFKTWDP
jgi:hypothetical protein